MTLQWLQKQVLELNQISPPGPGSYDLLPKPHLKECVPFNSTSIRKILKSNNPQQALPGPGDYNISDNLIKPNFTTYINDKNVIIKLNSIGSSCFRSSPRSSNQQKITITYQQLKPKIQNQHKNYQKYYNYKKQLKKRQKKNKIILSHTNIDNSKTLMPKQEQKIQPGPGSYTIDLNTINYKNKSYAWKLDKIQRFKQKKTLSVGPGQYSIFQFKKKKQNPSACFKSQTAKTFFDQLAYETSNQKLVNFRKQSHFKSNQPAPGQYQLNLSSLKLKKQDKIQAFGSLTRRFAKNNTLQSKQIDFYITHQLQTPTHKNKVAFNRSQQRSIQLNKKYNPNIGPGYYNPKKFKNNITFNKVQGHFGSLSSRQLDPLNKSENQQKQKTIQNIKQANIPLKQQISSFFKSRTKRQPFQNLSKAVLDKNYDITYNDISKKLNRQNIHINNLKNINVNLPPFQSKSPRFIYQSKLIEQKSNIYSQTSRVTQIKNLKINSNISLTSREQQRDNTPYFPQSNN